MLLQVAVFPTHRSMLLHVVVFPATTILMHSKLLLCGKQPIYLATFTRSGSRLCIGVNITPSLDPLSPNSMQLSLGEKKYVFFTEASSRLQPNGGSKWCMQTELGGFPTILGPAFV